MRKKNLIAKRKVNKNKISFQPGTQLKVRVTNIVPPSLLSTSGGLPTARPLDSSSKNILTGVVIGRLGSNIVLQTHSAPLAIYSGKAIPAGATVTFEILAQIPREMDSNSRKVLSLLSKANLKLAALFRKTARTKALASANRVTLISRSWETSI